MPNWRAIYLFLCLIIVAGLLALVLITKNYNSQYDATAEWVRHTIAVIDEMQQSLSVLHDIEHGRPTGAMAYHIAVLRKLTADNAIQQTRIDSLGLLLLKLKAYPPYRTVPAYYPDSLREVLLRMQSEESRLLKLRQDINVGSSRSLQNAIWGLISGIFILLCISSLLIFYHFNRRRLAEKGLREVERRFHLVVENIRDYAIFMLDPGGHIISWNEGALQIKGYTEDEVLGKHISIFYTPDDILHKIPADNLQKAATQGRYECVGARRRKDGSLFIADVVFTAMYDTKGSLLGFTKITRDITDQKRTEEEMKLALGREKELNEMKSRFVTLASHEFKTPLSVILSSTALIEKYDAPELSDKRHRHIQRIRSNVKNLRQILNDFLSLEKLEAGIVVSGPEPTDLALLAEEITLDMEEYIKKGQNISFTIYGQLRPVAVDPNLLRNVLTNLLSNAVKYSRENSTVRFELKIEYNRFSFLVADQGIGIPVDEQEHLFERFFRARNTTGIPGTGLGLSIVRKYLDLMKGDIRVSSLPGEGSVFEVSFEG